MLAKKRTIFIQGKAVATTPMLVPSFSSKGFHDPPVQQIIDYMSSSITDSALVSAYDVSSGAVKGPITFPSILFLDSGGYECSKDLDLSDLSYTDYKPDASWSKEKLIAVLDSWECLVPTLFVSYDNSAERFSVVEQIENAKTLFTGRAAGHELLIKPSKATSAKVEVAEVIANIHELRHFDVIGFTEKELGFSLFKKMTNIARIRLAMNQAGLDKPIHIFGSLDPISSPLYFLAGADIFDGLTWLRLAYHQGLAVYVHNIAALKHGSRINVRDIPTHIWFSNHHELMNLEESMKRYLKEQSFECFTYHAKLFETTSKGLEANI